jgi:SAM-dependent methyltransferase
MRHTGSRSLFSRAIRWLIDSNILLSEACEQCLALPYRIDGNQDFLVSMLPKYIEPALTVYDVGGGRHPYVTLELKQALHLNVVGLDVDQGELENAPAGIYDRVVCADICAYRGGESADLVICQAVLEHVKDTDKAFSALASVVKPGGRVLIFVPSRNAVFARLNMLLPEAFKQRMLYFVYPDAQEKAGFKSYYHLCTPMDFRRLAHRNGLAIEEERLYFRSKYFFGFFPAYLLWRLWTFLFCAAAGDQAAETFSMAMKKSSGASPAASNSLSTSMK